MKIEWLPRKGPNALMIDDGVEIVILAYEEWTSLFYELRVKLHEMGYDTGGVWPRCSKQRDGGRNMKCILCQERPAELPDVFFPSLMGGKLVCRECHKARDPLYLSEPRVIDPVVNAEG